MTAPTSTGLARSRPDRGRGGSDPRDGTPTTACVVGEDPAWGQEQEAFLVSGLAAVVPIVRSFTLVSRVVED